MLKWILIIKMYNQSLNSTRLSMALVDLPLTPIGMKNRAKRKDNNPLGKENRIYNKTSSLQNKFRGRRFISCRSPELPHTSSQASYPVNERRSKDSIYTQIDDGSFVEFYMPQSVPVETQSQQYYTCATNTDTNYSTSSKISAAPVGFRQYVDAIKNKHKPPFRLQDETIICGPIANSGRKDAPQVLNSTGKNGSFFNYDFPDISSLTISSKPPQIDEETSIIILDDSINEVHSSVLQNKLIPSQGIPNNNSEYVNNSVIKKPLISTVLGKNERKFSTSESLITEDASICSSAIVISRPDHLVPVTVDPALNSQNVCDPCRPKDVLSWVMTSPFKSVPITNENREVGDKFSQNLQLKLSANSVNSSTATNSISISKDRDTLAKPNSGSSTPRGKCQVGRTHASVIIPESDDQSSDDELWRPSVTIRKRRAHHIYSSVSDNSSRSINNTLLTIGRDATSPTSVSSKIRQERILVPAHSSFIVPDSDDELWRPSRSNINGRTSVTSSSLSEDAINVGQYAEKELEVTNNSTNNSNGISSGSKISLHLDILDNSNGSLVTKINRIESSDIYSDQTANDSSEIKVRTKVWNYRAIVTSDDSSSDNDPARSSISQRYKTIEILSSSIASSEENSVQVISDSERETDSDNFSELRKKLHKLIKANARTPDSTPVITGNQFKTPVTCLETNKIHPKIRSRFRMQETHTKLNNETFNTSSSDEDCYFVRKQNQSRTKNTTPLTTGDQFKTPQISRGAIKTPLKYKGTVKTRELDKKLHDKTLNTSSSEDDCYFTYKKSQPRKNTNPLQIKEKDRNISIPVHEHLTNRQGIFGLPFPQNLSFLSSLSRPITDRNLHPDAIPFLKSFKKKKFELATYLYGYFNEHVFEMKLPPGMNVKWNTRMRKTAGYCYYQISKSAPSGRDARIELSSKVIDSADRLRDTMIHEMCHAASWIVSGYKCGHGPLWKAWVSKAMLTFPELPIISRCHSYQISCKYTYECTKCGYSIGRHSKSIDVSKKVCGRCHGTFHLLLTSSLNPASASKTPRTPGPFAVFVKENYSSTKENGPKSHGDVMKALSKQFNLLKLPKPNED